MNSQLWELSAAKVKKYGQNLLDIDAGLNECLKKNDDGTYTFTKIPTGQKRFSAKIPFNFPYGFSVSCYADIIDTNLDTQKVSLILRKGNSEYVQSMSLTEDGEQFAFNSNVEYVQVWFGVEIPDGSYITFKNPQLTLSQKGVGKVTNYEPYIEPIEYAISADGTVEGVNSLYPTTTLVPDTNGVLVEAEYNRDINKAFEEKIELE